MDKGTTAEGALAELQDAARDYGFICSLPYKHKSKQAAADAVLEKADAYHRACVANLVWRNPQPLPADGDKQESLL